MIRAKYELSLSFNYSLTCIEQHLWSFNILIKVHNCHVLFAKLSNSSDSIEY